MNGTNRDRGRIGLTIFLVVLSIILTPIPGTIDDAAAAVGRPVGKCGGWRSKSAAPVA